MTNITETWRDIPDVEYSVSDQGRVASRRLGGWRIMKPWRSSAGYMRVGLHDGNGGERNFTVHKLVAHAFLGPKPTTAHEVNHKDGDKTNNCVDNLEWVTSAENIRHSLDILGHKRAHGEAHGNAALTESDVHEIRRRCAAGEDQRRVAADYGVNQSNVSLIARGKRWAWLS